MKFYYKQTIKFLKQINLKVLKVQKLILLRLNIS